MTLEAQTTPWTEPGYSDIATVEKVGDQIEIFFLNGDVVRLPARQFGIQGAFVVSLAEGEEGLAITVAGAGAERTITWSQLRAATDPEYAQEMRRQDAEESRRLGRRLRALREDHGLNQKGFADLVGMSSPQLSKIENGTSDLRFSTVQTLLRAMGGTLNDIAGPEALELSQKAIRNRAEAQGVGRDLMDRLLARAPRASVPALLRRAFDWDMSDLASGKVTPPQPVGVVFKSAQQQDATISPLVVLARMAAEIVRNHAELTPFRGVPDATELRTELGGGEIRLSSLLDWAWDSGVAVVPLQGRGGFCAATWALGDSPIAVLKETREFAVFWLFDLAHELGHIARGHLDSGGVVDLDNLRPAGLAPVGDDERERDANEFALRLLLGDYGALLGEVRKESRGHYLRFRDAVATVARRRSVSSGLLGMVAAHELSDIGEPKDRWGSATNLARAEGNGREVVTQTLFSRVDLGRLSAIDSMLIEAAVGP